MKLLLEAPELDMLALVYFLPLHLCAGLHSLAVGIRDSYDTAC